jgi:hypothetical protein
MTSTLRAGRRARQRTKVPTISAERPQSRRPVPGWWPTSGKRRFGVVDQQTLADRRSGPPPTGSSPRPGRHKPRTGRSVSGFHRVAKRRLVMTRGSDHTGRAPALFEQCGLEEIWHTASSELVRGGSPWARRFAESLEVIHTVAERRASSSSVTTTRSWPHLPTHRSGCSGSCSTRAGAGKHVRKREGRHRSCPMAKPIELQPNDFGRAPGTDQLGGGPVVGGCRWQDRWLLAARRAVPSAGGSDVANR